MRTANAVGLLAGLGLMVWPKLSHADPTMSDGDGAALLVWGVASAVALLSMPVALGGLGLMKLETRRKAWQVLGVLNVVGGLVSMATCASVQHGSLFGSQAMLYPLPQLGVGLCFCMAGFGSGRTPASGASEPRT